MFLGLSTLSGRALGNSWPYTGKAAIRKTIRTTVLFLENKRNVRALITCNLDFFFLFWESLRFHAQMKFRRPHWPQRRGNWPQKGTKCSKIFCAFCASLWLLLPQEFLDHFLGVLVTLCAGVAQLNDAIAVDNEMAGPGI